jgi:hypothetical protein
MDIDLHADLLRGVKEGEGEGRGPAALFTSADAITTDEFLRYEPGKHSLGVVNAQIQTIRCCGN